MIAPITARPCYYYRTLVWEYKQHGRNKKWVKVAGECMHLPFFVDDNTGRLLVDPRGADLDLHRDFQEEFNGSFFSTRDDAPGNVNSFLSRHGVVTSNRIKVEEYCIKPKNSLFILGTLAENPGIEVVRQPVQDAEAISSFSRTGFSLSVNLFSFNTNGSQDDFLSDSPALATPYESRPLITGRLPISGAAKSLAMPKQKVADALLLAGISNPAAWAAAGVTSGGMGMPVIEDPSAANASNDAGLTSSGQHSSAVQAGGFDPRPPVALMKGTNNRTFLISWRSQKEIARSLGWKCTLMIWGSPALALLSLYVFLNIEHLF